jgi:hypothetical protein
VPRLGWKPRRGWLVKRVGVRGQVQGKRQEQWKTRESAVCFDFLCLYVCFLFYRRRMLVGSGSRGTEAHVRVPVDAPWCLLFKVGF